MLNIPKANQISREALHEFKPVRNELMPLGEFADMIYRSFNEGEKRTIHEAWTVERNGAWLFGTINVKPQDTDVKDTIYSASIRYSTNGQYSPTICSGIITNLTTEPYRFSKGRVWEKKRQVKILREGMEDFIISALIDFYGECDDIPNQIATFHQKKLSELQAFGLILSACESVIPYRHVKAVKEEWLSGKDRSLLSLYLAFEMAFEHLGMPYRTEYWLNLYPLLNGMVAK